MVKATKVGVHMHMSVSLLKSNLSTTKSYVVTKISICTINKDVLYHNFKVRPSLENH